MRSHLLRLAARSTSRHRARTFLTAGTVALGVALLVVALSWVNGLFGHMLDDATSIAGHVRVVTEEYAAREQLSPIYENIQPVDPLVELLRSRPGVSSVQPRITTGVTVTVGEEIGDVFAIAVGAPEAYYLDHLEVADRLDHGRWFEREGELVLGRRVAGQLRAELGDEVVLLGMTQDGSLSPIKGTLTGISSSGNAFLDRQVYLPLEQAQWLTDIPGGAVEILIFGDRYQDAPALARSLRDLPQLEGMAVQSWTQRDPWASMMEAVHVVRGIIVFFIVLLAGLGILNTMMMSVLERTGEIGVLRAMGLGRLGAVGIFVFEALVIAAIGGVIGIVLGLGPALVLERRGIELGEGAAATLSADLPLTATIYADLSFGIVVSAFLLGLFAALLGGLLPAIRASHIQPVVAMRAGR